MSSDMKSQMTSSRRVPSSTDPREDELRAWAVFINPNEYTVIQRKLLIDRGVAHYQNNGEINEVALMEDVSQCIADSLDRPNAEEVVNDPMSFVDEPGRLALVFALSSVLVQEHPIISDDSRNGKVHRLVQEYCFKNIRAAAFHSDMRAQVRLLIGEVVYGRDDEDDYGPPAGQPVEGITRLGGGSGKKYFKIPLAHANRRCIARHNHEQDGELLSIIRGAYVYVPVSDVSKKFEEYYMFRRTYLWHLEEVIRKSIDEDAMDAYLESLSGITKRLDEIKRMGRDHILFEERDYPAKIKALLLAVESADDGLAELGEPLTSKAIHDALQEYAARTDADWIRGIASELSSPQKIGMQLSNYEDELDDEENTVEIRRHDSRANEYVLRASFSDFDEFEVNTIEDLLEFPCVQNLHEQLLAGKPVRWQLYSFVRYVFEQKTEFTVEDVKDWFNQYPWYDPDETEYQASYERERRMPGSGERPLPISCNNDNDNWSDLCIGRENCDYSLYASVDLKDDVYERLDG